jgi:competence protein ComEC
MRLHHAAVYVAIAALLTLFLSQWQWPLPPSTGAWAGIALLFAASGALVMVKRTRTYGQIGICIALGIALACGSVHRLVQSRIPGTIEAFARGEEQMIIGKLVALDSSAAFVALTLDAHFLAHGDAHIPVRGRVRVTIRALKESMFYGDLLSVRGTLDPLSALRRSYAHHLLSQGIVATMRAQEIRVQERGKATLLRILDRQKIFLREAVQRSLSEPYAAILCGLLLGLRESIPRDLEESFKRTGLTHILAISGYNITMVILATESLLFFLPRRWKILPSVILVSMFTLLTGASASAVRAAIMGTLGIITLHTREHTHRTILWTLTAMALWNPAAFWWDEGLHLSFLAIIGILLYGAFFQRLFQKVPKFFRETLAMTCATHITTLPWIAYRFQTISLIAPVSNLLVLPLVPPIMLTGFWGLLGALAWIPLGKIVMLPCLLLLTAMFSIITTLGALPWASFTAERFSFLIMCSVYSLIVLSTLYCSTRPIAADCTQGTPQ